jgi:hypothetical protein
LNLFGSFDPLAALFDDHELGGSFHVGEWLSQQR